MKLSQDWLALPECQKLKRILNDADVAAFFVGGCVRNSLMDLPISDFDLATAALPSEVMALAQAAGVKAIPTGIEHGTVTLIVDGTAFEITTFRQDVETTGRHASVAFSTDIVSDAKRRDFTMNALYADFDGVICDPLGGLPDLKARHVRFIGEPDERIREDYLRILRFFRFYTTYADQSKGPDSDALAGCSQNLSGLSALSRERVGAEVLKLLAAPDPCTAIGSMEATGVLNAVLPGASGRGLFPYVSMEFSADPMARLAALGGGAEKVDLRLSSKQSRKLSVFCEAMQSSETLSALAQSHGLDIGLNIAALRAAIFEQPLAVGLHEKLEHAAQAKFPVKARDLMPDLSGAALGGELKRMKADWIASEFTLTKAQLLGSARKPKP